MKMDIESKQQQWQWQWQGDTLACGQWNDFNSDRSDQQPLPRTNYSYIFHKNAIYIYGGIVRDLHTRQIVLGQQKAIYKFQIQTKAWQRLGVNFISQPPFFDIHSHSCAVFNNIMYLTGGRLGVDGDYLQEMWGLNLQSFNWKRQEVRGGLPQARQSANMLLHGKNFLFLYGGKHHNQILNDIHLYKIDNKIWIQVQSTNYQYQLPKRFRPAICTFGEYIYIFGGEKQKAYRTEVKKQLMNDFYQVRIVVKSASLKPDVWVKQILTYHSPPALLSYLMPYSDKHLILYSPKYNNLYLYHVYDIKWFEIKLSKSGMMRNNEQMICVSEKGYLYDGQNGIRLFSIDNKSVEAKIDETLKFKDKIKEITNQKVKCWDCHQNSIRLGGKSLADFTIFKETLEDMMPTPFSGLGLLLDNCILLQAKQCSVHFFHSAKERYMVIEDNGDASLLWETSKEFISDMLIFKTNVEADIDELQQHKEEDPCRKPAFKDQSKDKQKQNKEKQEERELKRVKQQAKRAKKKQTQQQRQFSRNFKLGALRLGDKILYLTKYGNNNENRRIFTIQRSKSHLLYKCYYYITQSNSVLDTHQQGSKRYIEEEFKQLLKLANQRRQAKNVLVINQLKEWEGENGKEMELRECGRANDVYFADRAMQAALQEGGIHVNDAVDVSMKCYLSLLYLKNENMKIFMSVGENKKVEVTNLQFFEKIDKQKAKNQKIVDMEEAFDLQHCNIVQVYYNHHIKKKINTFHNGVLIYHKNRLITRYRYPFGELFKLFRGQLKVAHNFLQMFGFIQVDDGFQTNMFKNNFLREDVLEDIFCRLKFVDTYGEKAMCNESSSKLRMLQNKEERIQGRKKVKTEEGNMVNAGNTNLTNMNKIEEKPVVIVAKLPLPSNVIEID